MKIVFVLEHYYPYLGGAEKLFKQLAQALVQEGHKVVVVTTQHRADLPISEQLAGVEVRRVKCYNRFLFTLLSLPDVLKAAKDADLIHTTTYNAAIPAWLVAKWHRKRVLITFHEYWGKLWFKLPFISRLQASLYFTFEQLVRRLPFDHYIAVSDATKNSLVKAGIPESKVKRIYNGVNYNRFSRYTRPEAPENKFTVLYFGRLGISKGLDLLIPAWGLYAANRTDACLQLVIPKYPEAIYREVNKLINQHCASAQVECYHELAEHELFQKVAMASAVAIPSYSEGFCFVAAETIAIGTPIISSGKGSLAEVVTGNYIEMSSQSVESLVQALADAEQGKWQVKPQKEFSFSTAIDNYLTFLRSVINKGSK